MKRGAPNHPKMIMLSLELEKVYAAHRKKPKCGGRAEAIGTLEVLWEWCSKYAIQGDIGKWPDDVIAQAVEWPFSGKELIAALIASRWLDNAPEPFRLVIHDIQDHATNCWRQNLEDAGLTWWDGSSPRKYKLQKKSRITPEEVHSQSQSQSQSLKPEPEPTRGARKTDLRASLADNSDWDLFVLEWKAQTGGDSGWPMAQQLFAGVVAEVGIDKLLESVRTFGRSGPWRDGKIDNMGKWFSARRYLETPSAARDTVKAGQRADAFKEMTIRRIGNAVQTGRP